MPNVLNYPKALYSKSRSKFWSYYARRAIGFLTAGQNAIGIITSTANYNSFSEFGTGIGVYIDDGINDFVGFSFPFSVGGFWNDKTAPQLVDNINNFIMIFRYY